MAHNTMERVTLRVPKTMLDRADRLIDAGEYPNQSEVFRDAIRDFFDGYDFTVDPPRKDTGARRRGGGFFPMLGGDRDD